MSDQDIRDQLEGLFSDIPPEPEVEKPGAAAPQAEGADEIKSGIEAVEVVNVRQVDVSSPRQGMGPGPRVTHPRGPKPRWHHMRNWPMATKLTLVTLLLLIVTLAATTFVTVRTARSTLSSQIGQNLEAQADSLSDLIGVYFLEKASQLQAVAAADVVKQSLVERNAAYVGSPDEILAEIQALDKTWIAAADDDPLILNIISPDSTLNPVAHQLANFLATFPDHSETFVTDRYGATVAATGRLSDYYQADEGWWQASWNDGKGAVYLSDPEYDESAGVSATLIAVPVFDDETGEVIGVVRSTLNVDGLYKLITARTFGQTGYALLLNGVGDVIFDPRAQAGDSAELPADLRQQFAAEVSNFVITADQQGDSSLFASTHLREEGLASGAITTQNQIIQAVAKLGWVTVVRQKASEALVSADQAVWSILLSGIVATLLVGLGLMFVTRVTTRPLTTLSAAAEEIGAGNLDAPLPAPGGDEIGRLAASFGKMVAQLRQTLETLEQRVAERTRARMTLAAAVGQRLSTVRDLDLLLSETVELIQESFDLYHAQIYLADPAGRYLTLRAGTGEAGAELVHRGHSLQIAQGSINGTAAALKQSVIVSDTSQSGTFLPNPLLPDTRSEIAVPLLIGERVVGVLDLQSAQPGALSADNLPAFEVLAGQLAIAIDNARLFSEAAQARGEVEAQLSRLAGTGWQEFLDGIERSERIGYAYERGKLEEIVDPVAEPSAAHALAVPIQIQGASIGAIQIEGESDRIWTEAEGELLETVARQVAQQADNLRLLAQAERYRAQAEGANRRLTREGWAAFLESQSTPVAGFTYDLSQVKPVTNGSDGRGPALSWPLEVRGESIGHLAIGEVDALDEEATQLLTTVAERLSDHIENLRLLEEAQTRRYELEERSRELEASQRVTFAASETSDPDELLDLVVNLIRDQFDLYHAQVYLADSDRQAAVLRKSTGYAGRQLLEAGHSIPLEESSLVTRAIRQGEPLVVNDVSEDENWMPNPLLPHTRSELVVPLRAGGDVIGVLDVQSRTPGSFTPGTVALFQTMAEQVAMNFVTTDLLARTTQQTEALTRFTTQLRTAADVTERLSAILDPDQLLSEVVEMLHSRFGLYHAHVYLMETLPSDSSNAEEAQGAQLVVRAGSGEVGKILCERGHRIPLDAAKSLVARAARNRETVYVGDTSTKSDFMPNPLLPQTRSEVAMPLIAGDQVLGVLDVQDDQPGRFAEAELDTFTTLAGQVATALQNAGYVEQVEARLKVSQALASTQTEEEVLDAIMQVADFYPEAGVTIQLFELEAEELTTVARRSAAFESGLQFLPQGMRIPASQFPLSRYIAPDKIFMTPNLLLDERVDPVTREIIGKGGAISMAILPVVVGSEWLGVIAASSKQEGYFDQRKLHLYQALAEQGAVALQSARLREVIHDSQQRFQGLVENLNDWIWEVDSNGAYTYVSPKVTDLLGYQPEEVLGKTPFDFMPADEVERVAAIFGEIVADQKLIEALENTNVHKDGHLVVFETSGTPIFDAQGKFQGYRGTDRDITERKQAEDALRQSEAQQRLIFESSPTPTLVTQVDGTILYANPQVSRLFGKPLEELISHGAPGLYYDPSERQAFLAAMERDGRVRNYDIRFKKADGTMIWGLLSSEPITFDGQPAFLNGVYDITELKEAQAAIRESQQRFQGLVENLNDWIWEVDPKGVYTYVSPKVTDLLGYQPEEVLGKTPFDFMPADEVERVAAIFGEIIAGQKPIEALENTNIHKDGHLVVFETSGTPIFDAQGKFQGYRGTDRDITERKQAEAAVHESQQMLQLVMNNIPHSIFWKDRDLVYLGCNQNFVEDAGKESPEEVIGKTDYDMPWLDQAEAYRADDSRVMEAGEPVLNYEEPQTTPDGNQIWLRTSKVPLHDANGDVMAVLGLYEDVTAEKQAEQILRESEERFRGLYESSPLGIILNDFESGDYLEANDAFLEMMGYTLDELNQLSYFDVTPRTYEADEAEQIRSMEETGRYGPYEKEYIRKDGSVFPVVLNGVLVTDSRGRRLIWSTVSDITERKRAEEAVLQEKNFSDTVINSLPGLFYLYDEQGRLVRWNRNFEEVSGYSAQELSQRYVLDFIAEGDRQLIAGRMQEVFTGGQSSAEAHFLTKSNEEIPYYFTGLRAIVGDKVYLAGVGVDITERVQAEQALLESQQMLQLIMNNIPQSIFWKDRDLVFMGCNRNFAKDAGLDSADEVVGKTDYDLPWLDQAELYRADDRRVMESGEPVLNYEEPQTTPDGGQIWLRTSKVPLHDVNGDVMAVLGLYADVTAEKEAEQILRESEERFRGLYESSPLGIILNDFEGGDYLEVNDAFLEMMGYTVDELNQLSYFDVTPQKYEADEAEQIRSMEETGRYGPYEKEYIRKDGSVFPVVLNGVLVTDSRGRKLIWSTVSDITERKRTEQERERFTNQLRTAAELTEQVNAILDPDQLLREVVTQLHDRFNLYHVHVYLLDEEASDSAAGPSLVMHAGSGEIGQVMLDRGHKIPLDRERSLVARAARNREIVLAADTALESDFMPNPLLPETRAEVAVPLMAGDRVLGVLDVQDNQPGRFTQSDLDIFSTLAGQISTALQNAGLFEEVQQTAERLREVDRLKSEFLANMSHELRTPLNSILGYTEVMLMGINGDLDAETQEDVQAIYDNGQHLLRLINDILDLAKIEAGRMALNLEDVEIAPLLEDIKTSSAGLLVNKPVEMILEVEEELPSIKADRTRVNQVLTNLVSNAAKFTEEGRISLRAFREGDEWIVMEVEDTGIGIQEADLENIFEQFRQADGSFKRRAEGTGLGLAITRHLVTMHGGTISVHSQAGSGSTFTVRLPIQSHAVEAISGSSNGKQM